MRGIGQAEMERGRYLRAEQSFERALQLYGSLDEARVGVAQLLFWWGMLYTRQARFGEAEPLFADVLSKTRRFGDRAGQAQALRGLAICQHERNDKDAAAASLEEALRLVQRAMPTFIEGHVQATIDDLGYQDMIAIELRRSNWPHSAAKKG